MDIKPTILIVDSASDNLMTMQGLLRERYTVRMAASGEGAFQKVAALPRPELILLDESLPDMDGYAILHELQSSFLTADIPVDVPARGSVTVHPKLQPQTGGVVVASDVRASVRTPTSCTRARSRSPRPRTSGSRRWPSTPTSAAAWRSR